jgi:hypothetical protein
MEEATAFEYKTKWAIESEMKDPACKEYMLKPFDQLEYSTDRCMNIYFKRSHAENDVPLTAESYAKKFKEDQRSVWMNNMQIGLIVATALSALLYAAGAVVAWIVSGFKRTKT